MFFLPVVIYTNVFRSREKIRERVIHLLCCFWSLAVRTIHHSVLGSRIWHAHAGQDDISISFFRLRFFQRISWFFTWSNTGASTSCYITDVVIIVLTI